MRFPAVFLFAWLASISAEAEIAPLAEPINTPFNDFGPNLYRYRGSLRLLFNSDRNGNQDFYESVFDERKKTWGKPVLLSSLSTGFNEEAAFVSPDGESIVFASDRDGSLEMPRDDQGRVRVSYDLYFSKRTREGSWDAPLPLKGVNTTDHERAPALSPDGKTVFFARWPFGQLPKSSLWQGGIQGDSVTELRKLPATVNNGHMEAGLVPAVSRKGYYFSSARSGGFGGWDIYFTDADFREVFLVGEPVSSASHDLYLREFEGRLYFCSNRQKGLGGYDIYSEELRQVIKIRVTDKISGKPIPGAEFRIGRGETEISAGKTAEDGEAALPEDLKPSEDLTARSWAKGYLPAEVDGPEWKEGILEIRLEPIRKDASFVLRSIHFDFNSDKVQKVSGKYLDELGAYLKLNSALRLKITGHTDLNGSAEYNLDLSRRRSESVKAELVRRGISSGRLVTAGAGKSRPIVAAKNPEADRKNRRTEFSVLEP